MPDRGADGKFVAQQPEPEPDVLDVRGDTPAERAYVRAEMERQRREAEAAAAAAGEMPGEPEPEPVASEGNEPSETTEPETEPETVPLYKVKVDGQEIEVPLEEALLGYQRSEAFKKRMQEVAEDRKALEREREALRITQLQGAPSAPAGGTWSGSPLNIGGQRPVEPSDNLGTGPGQATFAMAQPPLPSNVDPDEYVPFKAIAPLQQQVAQLTQALAEQKQALQAKAYEEGMERAIGDLGKKYPNFDRAAVEEQIALMSAAEQAELRRRMSKDAAYEYVHLTAVQPKQSAAAPVPQPKQTTPPFGAQPTRQVASPAPKVPPRPTDWQDHKGVADWWIATQEQAQKRR